MGMGYGGNLKAQSFENGWAFFLFTDHSDRIDFLPLVIMEKEMEKIDNYSQSVVD